MTERPVIDDERLKQINEHCDAAMRLIVDCRAEANRMRYETVPLEPRRVWPEHLPDVWRNGGSVMGDVLIARIADRHELFETIVSALTEKLSDVPKERTKQLALRATGLRLLQAFYDREVERQPEATLSGWGGNVV